MFPVCVALRAGLDPAFCSLKYSASLTSTFTRSEELTMRHLLDRAICVASVLAITLVATSAYAAGSREQISKPEAGTPDAVIQKALLAAINPDESAGFQAYLDLVHPDQKSTEKAITQLRRYSWNRFRKQAHDYIVKGTKADFIVTRRDPEKIEKNTKQVRIFLAPVANTKRSYPTPIRMQRENGKWLITANSL